MGAQIRGKEEWRYIFLVNGELYPVSEPTALKLTLFADSSATVFTVSASCYNIMNCSI